MLPHFWVLAWSFLQSCYRGYKYSNATDASQIMFNWNIAYMSAPSSASISLRPPTFLVKRVQYPGNVGDPYGSNIIEVSAEAVNQYKYVVRFEAPSNGQS